MRLRAGQAVRVGVAEDAVLIRLLWLLAYAGLSGLGFVVDKLKDYAADHVWPPKEDEDPKR